VTFQAETDAQLMEYTDEFAGGSIVNNVVQTLHRYFASRNYVTASFNFRYVLRFCIKSIFWQNRTVLIKMISASLEGLVARADERAGRPCQRDKIIWQYLSIFIILKNIRKFLLW
jgi:hypothetical protein